MELIVSLGEIRGPAIREQAEGWPLLFAGLFLAGISTTSDQDSPFPDQLLQKSVSMSLEGIGYSATVDSVSLERCRFPCEIGRHQQDSPCPRAIRGEIVDDCTQSVDPLLRAVVLFGHPDYGRPHVLRDATVL